MIESTVTYWWDNMSPRLKHMTKFDALNPEWAVKVAKMIKIDPALGHFMSDQLWSAYGHSMSRRHAPITAYSTTYSMVKHLFENKFITKEQNDMIEPMVKSSDKEMYEMGRIYTMRHWEQYFNAEKITNGINTDRSGELSRENASLL